MPARVPQDVDLEDKLVFGLSPLRFGYVVIGIIVAAAVWAAQWPLPLPLLAAVPIAAGAGLAVGRWRGHRLDTLAWDIATHLARNYRVELGRDLRRLTGRAPRGGRVVTVTATEPGVGATSIALELAVGLAMCGEAVQLWEPRRELHLRLGMMAPGRHPPTGIDVLSGFAVPPSHEAILVRSIPANEPFENGGRVVLVLSPGNRQAVPDGVLPLVNHGASSDPSHPAVPDDAHMQRAEALRESALVAFPDAPVSRTLKALAASLRDLVNE